MKLSVRNAILLYTLIPITVIFIVFAVENIEQTRKDVHTHIENHMTDLAYSYASLFDRTLNPIASIAKTTADILHIDHKLKESEIYALLRRHVEQNNLIYGAWVAFAPFQFDRKRKLVAPYVHRNSLKDIVEEDFAVYDYTDGQYEFWNKPVNKGKGVWTEPYFAKIGNIMMSSFTVPIFRNDQLIGVAGIDIPLLKISENIHIPGVKQHNVTVLSKKGNILLFPKGQYIGESIFKVIEDGYELVTDQPINPKDPLNSEHKKAYHALVHSMLSGNVGNADLTRLSDQSDFWYFYAPIKTPDWSFAIRVNESEIFGSVYNRIWYSLLFFSLLLLFIIAAVFLVSRKLSDAVAWVIERCLRIERMNFHHAPKVNSNIHEVRQLSRTLDRMSAALYSYISTKEDVRIAQAIRAQTLPSKMRMPPGFQFLAWSRVNQDSCGDTFDSVDFWQSTYSHSKELLGQKPEGTAYLLLDSPDKGVDGAVKNTHLRAIFSSYAKLGVNLLDTVQYMNDYLQADLALPGPVHAWLGVIDHLNASLSTISLGLIKVLHYSAKEQSIRVLQNYPFALSMQKELPELRLQQISLQPGDLICVISGGLYGAINDHREQYGIDRLIETIKSSHSDPLQNTINLLIQNFMEFTENSPIPSDATMMLIQKD